MSDLVQGPELTPIEGRRDLVEFFHRAAKPRQAWAIGTEYEKVGVDRATARAIPFSGPRGVEAILRRLAERCGWEPREEGGRVVGLARGAAAISLEPGGQIELSGAPWRTLHEASRELTEHVRELMSVGEELGVAFLGLGIQPLSGLEEIEWVPKRRYAIMAPYMRRVGTLGERMMKQTATVQANVDYGDEADAMAKLRVGTAMAPLLNAMFANSAVVEGEFVGYMSFRGHIWTRTDPARCGLLRFALEREASFDDYVDYALEVPLYFVIRDGVYDDRVTGITFRRFLERGFEELRPTLEDWRLHLTTLFPEARLKPLVEIRSADSQPVELMLAVPAMVKGIFYEDDCLEAAWDIAKRWRWSELMELYMEVHRKALQARIRGIKVLDLARELVSIAAEGLRRQHAFNDQGEDERIYLGRLEDQLRRGKAPAEVVVECWEGQWNRDVARLVSYASYSIGQATAASAGPASG